MPTVRLRPNGGTKGSFWTDVGSTIPTSLNDDSDGTYLQGNGISGTMTACTVSFGTFAFPAGATIQTVTPIYRIRPLATGDSTKQWWSGIVGESFDPQNNVATDIYNGAADVTVDFWGAARTSKPGGGAWAAANVDALELQFKTNKSSTWINYRVFELYVDVVYNVRSVVSGVTVPAQVREDLTVSWTYNDSDGDTQYSFLTRIFTSAVVNGGGFDPETSSYVMQDGIIASAATSHALNANLSPGRYYVYVKTGDTGTGAYSDWAGSSEFRVVNSPLMML